MGHAVIAEALLACALNVHPATLSKIISVESGGHPLAVNVNNYHGPRLPIPRDKPEAIARARAFIAMGYRVDLGLMQITDRNLTMLGMSLEDAFDPCTNVRGGAAILASDYAQAVKRHGEGQAALKEALSAYNTGTFWRGFENGYVAKYYRPGAVPAIARVAATSKRATPPNPYTADTSVFVAGATHVSID